MQERRKVSPLWIIPIGIILGVGAGLGLLNALARVERKVVTVALENPPSGATMWSLALLDWDVTAVIDERSGKDRLDITEAASFAIPSGLEFPLRVASLQITRWNEDRTALIVLYEVQSYRPYLWDWEAGEWSDIPDPGYRPVFIPSDGGYFYNVAAELFEEA